MANDPDFGITYLPNSTNSNCRNLATNPKPFLIKAGTENLALGEGKTKISAPNCLPKDKAHTGGSEYLPQKNVVVSHCGDYLPHSDTLNMSNDLSHTNTTDLVTNSQPLSGDDVMAVPLVNNRNSLLHEDIVLVSDGGYLPLIQA